MQTGRVLLLYCNFVNGRENANYNSLSRLPLCQQTQKGSSTLVARLSVWI